MNTYLVTYFIEDENDALGLPMYQYFVCESDNVEHAIEQLKDAYHNGNVLQVHCCQSVYTNFGDK